VVIVTHDVSFAREVADDAIILCAGRILAACPFADLDRAPPCDLVARFLRDGNCWPCAPLAPELPSHFKWVIDRRLAGMGRPGLLRDADEDLASIAGAGITRLVSLTEDTLASGRLRSFGIHGRHFPVPDMGVPAIGPTAALCRDIERWLKSGEVVAVHCRAGLGRTGVMLASVLVWMGAGPDVAIEHLRERGKGFIQTEAQLRFVHRFAEAT
jgi:atypical dual specificity phosphatase